MESSQPPAYSLRQLAYFVAVAEAGTLSAAAAHLHVSQSALSLAITELERSLGVQLCVRRKAHGVTVTSAGSRVLRQARDLLRLAADVEAEATSPDGQLAGGLRLGCFLTLAPTVLPRLLQGFTERHPRVTIDFVEGTQDALQRRLLGGELDLVVLYDMDILPEVERIELFRMHPHVLLPAGHRLAGSPVSLHELVAEPMVLLDAPPSSHHTMLLCREAGVEPTVRYRTTNFETARALVGRGLGWAILIQRPANDRTYEGLRVVPHEIAELPGNVTGVLMAWQRGVRLTQRARAFVDYCRETTAT